MGHGENIYNMEMANATYQGFIVWIPGCLPLISNTVISTCVQIRSDQFSRSVESDSLRPHESQHARPPCPSPTPRVHPDSYPSSQ